MEAEHTPGLIRVFHGANLVAADGYSLTRATGGHSAWTPRWSKRAVANARRVMACWNACDGIPTETLEAKGRAALTQAEEN